MVARFNFTCDFCGHDKFTAAGLANDMPNGESDDEWQFRLIFTCDSCNNVVTEVLSRMNKQISFEMKLSR
jgi:transcription elongation factor Elf1